jgi:hypothetical protein
MVKEEDILSLPGTMKEVRRIFSAKENLDDKPLYNFFKAEIKPVLAYIDNSIIQTNENEPKRKYVGGYWNAVSNQRVQVPWVRIGIGGDRNPSLELVVSVDEQIPKVDLEADALGGIGYTFNMGIEYSYRHTGLMIETVIKSVTSEEHIELLKIANSFHKKFKPYS